jgi:hypothetical protein
MTDRIPRLTGDQLLELMVACELRNRQRRATDEEPTAPFRPCPLCGQPVDTQTVTLGLKDFDERVLTVGPCGCRMTYNLKVAKQYVSRANDLADQAEEAATEATEADTCRPVEVDGELVRVRGSGKLTEEGQEAVAALVRVAKAKLVAEAPERVGYLQEKLRLAHKARRAKEHQLDGVRRALCDAGFMEEDDPYGHADLDEVIRQAGTLVGPLVAEVAAAREFAGEMREFASPHGVSVDYADRLLEAMDRAKEAGR